MIQRDSKGGRMLFLTYFDLSSVRIFFTNENKDIRAGSWVQHVCRIFWIFSYTEILLDYFSGLLLVLNKFKGLTYQIIMLPPGKLLCLMEMFWFLSCRWFFEVQEKNTPGLGNFDLGFFLFSTAAWNKILCHRRAQGKSWWDPHPRFTVEVAVPVLCSHTEAL